MRLLDEVLARCGDDAVAFGCAAKRYKMDAGDVTVQFDTAQGERRTTGEMLIAADGVHSAIRKQMYPGEGPPVWGGGVMWRGTTVAEPFLSGASMILAGNDTQRFVCYPITKRDEVTGKAVLNWIAEKTVDPSAVIETADWNRQVNPERFYGDFEAWNFGWIDVPGLIREAEAVFEYPMVDLEPVARWTDGPVTLIGDAAHATYPVGSSGASQAILDARILGAAIVEHGTGQTAAEQYESRVRPLANGVTLANRGRGGPDAIMQIAEDRCGGDFSLLDRALPMEERKAHADGFKKLAGLTIEDTNGQPPLIATG